MNGNDLNSVPEMDLVHSWKTPASEDQKEPSVEGALAVGSRFGLKPPQAKAILREVYGAVSGWRNTARRLGIKAATIEPYTSAFEHEVMDEARTLLEQ